MGEAELVWARPSLPKRMDQSQGSRVRAGAEALAGGQVLAHHGIEVIAQQGAVVVDLSLQDDEQEEQPQEDVAQVAEDVVEGATGAIPGALRWSQTCSLAWEGIHKARPLLPWCLAPSTMPT